MQKGKYKARTPGNCFSPTPKEHMCTSLRSIFLHEQRQVVSLAS
jgi:hypothetical protein